VDVSAASRAVLTKCSVMMTIDYNEEVEMPLLWRLDLRGGFTRGVGRSASATSAAGCDVTVKWDATGVAKADVT
jgi:hypothetical protein